MMAQNDTQNKGAENETGPPTVSQEFLASIVANLKSVVFCTDVAGRWTFLNPAWTEMTGFDVEESLYCCFIDFVHPDDREQNTRQFEPLIRREKSYCRHEIRYIKRDGGVCWVEVYARLTIDERNEVVGTTGTLTDITDKKRNEEESIRYQQNLEEANRFIREVTQVAPNIIYVFDIVKNRNIYSNHEIESILGYRPEEIAEMGSRLLPSIIHPDDLDLMMKHYQAMSTARDGELREVLFRVRHANGIFHWMRSRDTVFRRDDQGKVIQILGVTEDVTARTESENALRRSEARLSTLIESFQSAVLVEDENRCIGLTNPLFCRLFDIAASPDSLIGMDCVQAAEQSAAFCTSPQQFLRRLDAVLQARQPVQAEEIRLVNGRILERDYVPISVSGDYYGHLWLYRDITDRKRAEERLEALTVELQRSNRELAHFASVASHDLQEPLRKIRMFGDCLLENLGDSVNEEAQYYLNRMRDAASRMKLLIDGLLQFSHVTTKARPFVSVTLNQIIREVIDDLEVRLQETQGEVITNDLPVIVADPLQMRQLFQNLLGNALKFHRPGVPPVVQIQGEVTSEWAIGGDWLTITIKDNGIGFASEHREEIFNVFERLHDAQEYDGTGIGLAICRKIVERHDGLIAADAVPGQGATFTLRLPLSHDRDLATEDSLPHVSRFSSGGGQ